MGDRDDAVSSRVVSAVATEAGVDPMTLPPLQDTIDTDALDTLGTSTAGRQSACTVQFAYAGWSVEVRDGEVTVSRGDRAADD